MTGVQVEVLGPLRLLVDGRPMDVRGPKRRALLALLATAGGRAVTVDHLLDALWADDLPESAQAALQSHVSRVRTHLGIAGSRLQRLDGAYRLVLDADGLAGSRMWPSSPPRLSWPSPCASPRCCCGCGFWPRPAGAARTGDRADVPPAAGHETGPDPSPELGELERAVAGGLVGGAPPPRAAPTAPLTPLVGRDAQVAALHRLLRGERLVTVVGPGGVGKTRLALEVASRADAVAVVRLAPVTDPAAIPHAFASALDLRVVQGDVLVACATLLASRPEVLMVDNC